MAEMADHDTDARRAGGQAERRRWWETLRPSRLTLTLENKGSVARDHLANERTFLAWLRTSLSMASIGIAVAQLFRLNNASSSTQALSQELLSLQRLLHNRAGDRLDLDLDLDVNLGDGWNERSLALLAALVGELMVEKEAASTLKAASNGQMVFSQPMGYNSTAFVGDGHPSAGYAASPASTYRSLGKPLGSTFLALALVYLVLGVTRYYHVQDRLTMGLFPASRFSIGFTSLATAAVTTGAFVAVLLST